MWIRRWYIAAWISVPPSRTPSRAPERLLLLLGMAGFLVIGLSIPRAFGADGSHGSDGVALGLGSADAVRTGYAAVRAAGDAAAPEGLDGVLVAPMRSTADGTAG